jgi:hypothetical protein
MRYDRVPPEQEDLGAADTALECASSEAVIPPPGSEPLIQLRNFEGQFIRNLTYSLAQDFLRKRLATLKRNRSGRTRYLEMAYNPDDIQRHQERVEGVPLTTDASRTVRRQHLLDTHWTWQHIRQDLDEKAVVEQEERSRDGITGSPTKESK